MNLAVVEREEVGVAVEREEVLKVKEKDARYSESPVRGRGQEAI